MLQIFIFDVGNRSCAYLADSSGHNMMIDCAKDEQRRYSPALNVAQYLLPPAQVQFKVQHPLTTLVITHAHRDHISDLGNVLQHLRPYEVIRRYIWEYSPASIENADDPSLVIHRDYLDQQYIYPIVQRPIWHLRYQAFSLTPAEARAADPQREINNSSIVTLVEYAGRRILFGGDMEEAGWIRLLCKPDFFAAVTQGIDIFVTAHHGHRSGYCDLLQRLIKRPFLHIASLDGGNEHLHPNYCTAEYARGHDVFWWHDDHKRYFSERRNLLTTRTDGHVKLNIHPNGFMSVFVGHREAVLLPPQPTWATNSRTTISSPTSSPRYSYSGV